MSDMCTETLLTLQDATRHVPGSPHVSTLYRWVKFGLRGIRLESCRVGGRRVTSVEALARFSKAITRKVDGAADPRAGDVASPLAQVERDLDRAGI